MYSADQYIDVTSFLDDVVLVELTLRSFAERHHLQAILIARCDPAAKTVSLKWAFNTPSEPFNGTDNNSLRDAIAECFKIHPKPHVHSIKDEKTTLSSRVQRYNRALKDQYRMWFIPLKCREANFVFLAFPQPGEAKTISDPIIKEVAQILYLFSGLCDAANFRSRSEVTERFVKEIGHDLASTVQAAVAKIRSITDRRVTGDGALLKAKEIEEQIWDSYRIAELLGIAVDSNYQLRQPTDFDVRDSARTVLRHLTGEASERHVRFRLDISDVPTLAWGDKPAIEQALGQLVSNAIKYTSGGSEIIVGSSATRDDVTLTVKNKPLVPLPTGAELLKIWDFGYRGAAAKEKHVNGSGIGLYSVKKVVVAHHGWVAAESTADYTIFSIHLPTKEKLKKTLGVLL